jgi:hypothetical protein
MKHLTLAAVVLPPSCQGDDVVSLHGLKLEVFAAVGTDALLALVSEATVHLSSTTFNTDSQQTRMSAVFEDFLRNFYSYEQRTFSVRREVFLWEAEPLTAGALG